MISKELAVGHKPLEAYRERKRSSQLRSLPDCLTTRNFELSNTICGNQRTTPNVTETQINQDKVIAMELPEVPSFAEAGRATRKPGKSTQSMRVDGNSIYAGPEPDDLLKDGSSDEGDCDGQNGNDRRHASCKLVTRQVTSLGPLRARSLNSTPFHEMSSGKGANGGLPGCLLAQSVDSVSTRSNAVAVSSMVMEGKVRKVRDIKRRIPPMRPTRKHPLAPLEHQNSRSMSIEGTQFSTKTLEKDQENSIDFNLQGNQERREINKEHTNCFLSPARPTEIENVITSDKPYEEGNTTSEAESKLSLPSISVSQPSDRYKSRFRVKLLPLVTKSDSLPNLTEPVCSQSSGLLVTSSLGHSTPALHLKGISEGAEREEETEQKEADTDGTCLTKRARTRSLSVDSAFLPSELTFVKGAREIAIDGNKLLPEIKAGPMAKKSSLLSLKSSKKAEKMWFPPNNNLP